MRDTINKSGSALIMVVVLTSLLAIVGVMFIMAARVNKMETSAVSENKDLNAAVDTVIAKISEELVLDIPGMPKGSEYCDYPDSGDKWLASLEPYRVGLGNYRWRQISNVYGRNFNQQLNAAPIDDYQAPSAIGDSNSSSNSYRADADGDGVADAKWVEIDDITSSGGKPIYAAIRVIDNGAMLNVNTAYDFDPNSAVINDIDGSELTQIDLLTLARRSSDPNSLNELNIERFGSEPTPYNLDDYIRDVVWHYDEPDANKLYTPFDIADELEIRNRFTLNRTDVDCRLENVWTSAFKDHYLNTPIDSPARLNDPWIGEVFYDLSKPDANRDYSYRHIGTIYNMDRIINPYGGKMLNINNINDANENDIYGTIRWVISGDPNFTDPCGTAAQITVNLIDFRDNDSNVFYYPVGGTTYYGFEQPCIYISELAHTKQEIPVSGGPMGLRVFYHAYAIELYKPYPLDDYPTGDWRLRISRAAGSPVTHIINWPVNKDYYVIKNDPCSILPAVDPCSEIKDVNFILETAGVVDLQRRIDDVNNPWITVDSRQIPAGLEPNNPPMAPATITNSLLRDINPNKCIRRLWSGPGNTVTLGSDNGFTHASAYEIQAHPADDDFTNVGEIGMVFRKCAYSQGPDPIDSNDTEADVRVNLENSGFQELFNYLTVFDPTDDGIDNDNDGIGTAGVDADELKIPGRININTAPMFVLAQLPWMRYDDSTPFKRADDVIDKRDNTLNGFKNIGQLLSVPEMKNLESDGKDNRNSDPQKGPDITYDTARDDIEERDVIFTRISNLVTVRSDVFTAFILVRIGKDGPQKRVMAILDRSNVYSGNGKVRIIAVHPAPDPR